MDEVSTNEGAGGDRRKADEEDARARTDGALERAMAQVTHAVEDHPSLGVAAAGVAALVAASAVGVSEAIFAAGAGYVAYRAIRRWRKRAASASASAS